MRKKIKQFLFAVLRFIIVLCVALTCLTLSLLILFFSFQYSAHIIYTFSPITGGLIVFLIAVISGIAFSITMAGFVLSIVALPDYLRNLRPWDMDMLKDYLIKLNNIITSISSDLFDIKDYLERNNLLNLSILEYIHSIETKLDSSYTLICKLISVSNKDKEIGTPETKAFLYKISSNILKLKNTTATLKDTFTYEHQILQSLNDALKPLFNFTKKSNSTKLIKQNLAIVKSTKSLIHRNSDIAISQIMSTIRNLSTCINKISNLIGLTSPHA